MESKLAQIQEIVQESLGRRSESALVCIRELLEKPQPVRKNSNSRKKIPVSLDASGGGEYSVFGPTSAFLNIVEASSPSIPIQFSSALLNMSQLVGCIENFFKGMYPDVTVFIHRESFLAEFLSPGVSQGYCSEELVYAIAALGAKCSHSEELQALAQGFFDTARNSILTKKICVPQINTLQALLCLSLFELGEGNASASWMFSGMAIRMGYDLGFQLDPEDWAIDLSSSGDSQQALITNQNVMVRSRIYWGCYIVDHFISLVMGRPVTVRKTEASIPSSEVLPNSKNIDGFVFQPSQTAHGVGNLDAFQTIEPLCLLSECIGSLLTDIYTGESTDEHLSYLNKMKLARYNEFLASWRHKLPVNLRWTDSSLRKQDFNPTIANYRLFYYIVLICLNKPFLNVETDVFREQSPQLILDTAISELAICLGKFNESSSPPSILIVYSSILGLSIALLQVQDISKDGEIEHKKLQNLEVFYTTVSDACSYWKLATKSLLFVRRKVKDIGHPTISKIFDSVTELFESNLGNDELTDLMSQGYDLPNWANQDNLFANFFDFIDHQS